MNTKANSNNNDRGFDMNSQEETSKSMTPNLPLWSYQLQPDSKLAVRTRKDLEIHLITRALKDDVFKQELVANPKAVIEKELGTKLSEDLEINVFEETENILYMVLPSNPYEGLSQQEMKASLGMNYEDVARWVLDQQRNTLLDNNRSLAMIVKAWNDQVYNQELLTKTKAVIEKELGTPIPENVELKVLVETPNLLYILIPLQFKNFNCASEILSTFEIVNASIIVGSGSGFAGGGCAGGGGCTACTGSSTNNPPSTPTCVSTKCQSVSVCPS